MPPRQITDQETVQGQVKGLISQGSPLMKQAETRALEKQNAMGMGNSTRAIQAGQAALYDAALPIAQQDAQTYAKSGQSAQEYEQQGGLLSTEYGLKGELMESEYGLKGELMESEYGQKGILSAQEAKQQGELLGAEYGYKGELASDQNRYTLEQISRKGDESLRLQDAAADDTLKQIGTQSYYDTQQQELIGEQQSKLADKENYYETERTKLEEAAETERTKIEGEQRLEQLREQGRIDEALTLIDGEVRKEIAAIQANGQAAAAGASAAASRYAADVGLKRDLANIDARDRATFTNYTGTIVAGYQSYLNNVMADSSMSPEEKVDASLAGWEVAKTNIDSTATIFGIDDFGLPDQPINWDLE